VRTMGLSWELGGGTASCAASEIELPENRNAKGLRAGALHSLRAQGRAGVGLGLPDGAATRAGASRSGSRWSSDSEIWGGDCLL